ncbi:MAG: BACON domain-containing protein [Fermentimonas sp.]|jgi:hypothetical protein
MKTYLKIFLSVVLVGLFFGSCDDSNDDVMGDPFIHLSSSSDKIVIGDNGNSAEIEVDASGNSFELGVQSNGEWYAESADSKWVALTNADGKLMISVGKNDGENERVANIVLKDELSRKPLATVVLKQKGEVAEAAELSVELKGDDEVVLIAGAGGEYEVKINSSGSWTATTEATWLTLVEDVENNTLNIKADKNIAFSDRTAVVQVKAGESESSAVEVDVMVIQMLTEDAMVLKIRMTDANQVEMEDGTTRYRYYVPINDQDHNYGKAFINCLIDWGDGTAQHVMTARPYHSYEKMGDYEIRIIGLVESLNSSTMEAATSANRNALIAIENWGNTGLRSLKQGLYNSINMERIAMPNAESFSVLANVKSAFSGCEGLTSVPDRFFADCKELTDAYEAFSSCRNIKTLPKGLFAGCDKLDRVNRCFWAQSSESSIFESIPSDMFEGCTALTDVSQVFYGAQNLKSIPEDLFVTNTAIKKFTYAFNGCSALTSIPENLFANNTNATDMSNTFNGCSSLKSIPEKLFANNMNVTTFSGVFRNCTGLTIIPKDIFANNTKVTNYSSAFSDCTGLTSIDASIFANAPNVTNFSSVFKNCTGLTSIPKDIFANHTKVTNYSSAFDGCTALKSVDAGLFAASPKVTNFSKVFNNCTTLTSVPVSIFDNNREVTNFSGAFAGCSQLGGESPYTVVAGSRIHLYQRNEHEGEFKTVKNTKECFKECTKLTDYGVISGSYADWL